MRIECGHYEGRFISQFEYDESNSEKMPVLANRYSKIVDKVFWMLKESACESTRSTARGILK